MNGRLYRSNRDRMLAGVAGGLAEMWDADPSLVRIAWALLVLFTGGLALIVYIVMAVVVPEEDDRWATGHGPSRYGGAAGYETGDPRGTAASGTAPAPEGLGPEAQAWVAANEADAGSRAERRAAREARRAARGDRGSTSGALLGGALLILIGIFFLAREFLPAIDFDWLWPLVLVGLGVLLVVTSVRRDDGGGGRGGAS